jgi:hypothetical protein
VLYFFILSKSSGPAAQNKFLLAIAKNNYNFKKLLLKNSSTSALYGNDGITPFFMDVSEAAAVAVLRIDFISS